MKNYKLLLFVVFMLHTAILSQTNSTIVVSQSGQIPSLALDNKGNAFISWEEVTTTESGETGLIKKFAEYNSSGDCLIPATSLPGSGYNQPKIIPGKDRLLWIWTQEFMETYAYCQILNSDGTSAEDPYFIGQGRLSSGFANSNDSFTIVWNGYGGGVFVQTYPPASSPVMLVSRESLVQDPIYLLDSSNSSRTLVWAVKETSGYNLFAESFAVVDTPITPAVKINSDSTGSDLFYFSAAKSKSGETIILWSSKKNDVWQVNRRVFSRTGELSAEQIISDVSDSTIDYAANSISVNNDGESMAVWEGNRRLIIKCFDADGNLKGKALTIVGDNENSYQGYPNVVYAGNTMYLAWMDGATIKMRLLNADTLFSSIGATKNTAGNISRLMIIQNYPNPFNPSTTINYQIPKAGYVSIKVYDALGRDVSTLLNEYKEQGSYSCSFNASNLSSGMYFYTMKSGGYTTTKKMLLLK